MDNHLETNDQMYLLMMLLLLDHYRVRIVKIIDHYDPM